MISLAPGTTYNFVVKSRNLVGQSLFSTVLSVLAGQKPDAPTSLANVPAITTGYQVGLSWSAPAFDGGSAIIDYAIWYEDGAGSTFKELVSGLTTVSYTALSLTPGITYQFKVKVRNIYGYGEFSSVISILTA